MWRMTKSCNVPFLSARRLPWCVSVARISIDRSHSFAVWRDPQRVDRSFEALSGLSTKPPEGFVGFKDTKVSGLSPRMTPAVYLTPTAGPCALYLAGPAWVCVAAVDRDDITRSAKFSCCKQCYYCSRDRRAPRRYTAELLLLLLLLPAVVAVRNVPSGGGEERERRGRESGRRPLKVKREKKD